MSVVLTCVSCGFSNPSGHRFCGGCGLKLDEVSPSVLAERRFVSVLFVDLVGFTPFSEGRDSEDVRAMLARYFELARAANARHGGVVDKLMGDGVMAVWGARTVREDDAEQAVLAALEILEGVEAIGEGIGARAGVNSGEAAVDMSGQDAGMVIGDLVNTAARLESAALPGTVLVGAGSRPQPEGHEPSAGRTWRREALSSSAHQTRPLHSGPFVAPHFCRHGDRSGAASR